MKRRPSVLEKKKEESDLIKQPIMTSGKSEVIRGIIPYNKQLIQTKAIDGVLNISNDELNQQTNRAFNKNIRRHKSVLSRNKLGYNSLYVNPDYHIINDKGNNLHHMSVQVNAQSIQPYKGDFPKAMSFQHYCKRPEINK